jgi:hypothetical protein
MNRDASGQRLYVHQRVRPDGSSVWFVVNSETRRLATKTKFHSYAAAEARRAKLQAEFERQAVQRFLSWGQK